MKKAGVLFLVLLVSIISISFVHALNQTMDERAYSCLESKVSGKCQNLPLEDRVFALLALSNKQSIASECQAALQGSGGTSYECMPIGNCDIKSTALAVLALTQSGASADNKISWLRAKSIAPTLVWYIQMDTAENTTCKVTYPSAEYTVKVNSDRTLTIPNNACLKVISPYNYWLGIDKSCIANTFTVSCNSDFVSSLVYKNPSTNTIFVSSSLESASAQGTTSHQASSQCLGTTSCDYQGTLWAAYALMKAGKDYKQYLPYLFAFADDNKKYVPYAFLYVFTAEPEYLQKLILEQKTEGNWDWSSGKGTLYDTATTLLALQSESTVISTVRTYLEGRQATDGCWENSVTKTGFLIWALTQRASPSQTTQQICQNAGFNCVDVEGDCTSAGGNVLSSSSYYCSGLKVCCDKPPVLQTCEDKGGKICTGTDECSSSVISAKDTELCCLATCGAISFTQTECEQNSYTCKSSCNADEQETTAYLCSGQDKCCKPAAQGTSAWVWIILFLILIGLGALGYVYREKVKLWYNQLKQKFGKKGPSAAAPAVARPRPPYPPYYPQAQKPAYPRTKATSDIEETLKKLRDIGK